MQLPESADQAVEPLGVEGEDVVHAAQLAAAEADGHVPGLAGIEEGQEGDLLARGLELHRHLEG